MKPDKYGIKITIFIFLGILIFGVLQEILKPKWTEGFFDSAYMDNETNRYETFYQLEKDSLDYITLGHSKTFYSINPMVIYTDTGYIGYDLGCGNEGISLTYYWMEEALRYQSPIYMFWDASSLLSESEISSNLNLEAVTAAKALTDMRFGLTKIRACIANQTENRNWAELLFPLLSFHMRWKELGEADFFHNSDEYVTMGAVMSFKSKYDSHIMSANRTDYKCYDLSGKERQSYCKISEDNRDYFDRIYQLCEKNKVCLVPILGATTHLTEESRNVIKQFLNDYNLDCLDFTDEKTGIDWYKDTFDTGNHVNYWGGAKYSILLSKWMEEQEKVPRLQSKKVKAFWNDKLEKYQKLETENLMRDREQTLTYLNILEENKDKCIIFISVQDEACEAADRYLENYLKQLGLQGGFSEKNLQNSYLAVIDEGKVLFERWEAAPIQLEDKRMIGGDEFSIQLLSGGFLYGNTSKIQLGETDYTVGSRGINIVVLDKESGKVISSVGIDTHDEEWTFTQQLLDGGVACIWDEYMQQTQILPDGIYMICPYGNPDYAFDISGGSWEDNANLQLWDNTGKEPQQFELRHIGQGLYTIKAMNSGKYLTAYQFGNVSETNVVQDTYTGLSNQKWYIYQEANGAYCVMSHYNKLVMDVAGTKSGAGVNIFLYEPVQGDWQSFEFCKLPHSER